MPGQVELPGTPTGIRGIGTLGFDGERRIGQRRRDQRIDALQHRIYFLCPDTPDLERLLVLSSCVEGPSCDAPPAPFAIQGALTPQTRGMHRVGLGGD